MALNKRKDNAAVWAKKKIIYGEFKSKIKKKENFHEKWKTLWLWFKPFLQFDLSRFFYKSL